MDANYKLLKKRILITGASGQLGNSLKNNLPDIFDILATSKKNNKNLINLDITDTHSVKNILTNFKPNIIVNCAAITNVDFCEKNRALCRSVNSSAIQNLIKYSNKDTIIIHFSSDYVFNGKYAPYSESDPTHPINFYGRSKLEAENILIGSNRKHIILRVNGLFTSNLSFSNFMSWVFWKLNNNNNINVVNDQISNPTFIDLLSNVLVKSILMNAEGIFNYGSNNYISRYDFALEICKVFNFSTELINKINTDDLNQVAIRPLNTSLKIEKIEDIIGIKTYNTEYSLNMIKKRLNIK